MAARSLVRDPALIRFTLEIIVAGLWIALVAFQVACWWPE